MQEAVTLLVTEAELVAATTCVQDMMYTKNIMESTGFKIKLPMKLYVHNRGVKDFINNWSVAGRTCHIKVCYFFLHKLKKEDIARVDWIKSNNYPSDLFTKTSTSREF
jgi:hypothetical protein